jgi:hypothetical protein
MDMHTIREEIGKITKELPEKTYLRRDVKLVLLEVIKKLEECDEVK